MSTQLMHDLDSERSKSRKLKNENEKLILLLHEILDICYGERRDCGSVVEGMIVEKGIKIQEDFSWTQRD